MTISLNSDWRFPLHHYHCATLGSKTSPIAFVPELHVATETMQAKQGVGLHMREKDGTQSKFTDTFSIILI